MPCTIYGEYLPEELLLWQQGKVSLRDPINNWNGRTVILVHASIKSSIQKAFADLGSLEEGDCQILLEGEEIELFEEEENELSEGENEWEFASATPFYSSNGEENLTVAEILAKRGMTFDSRQENELVQCKSFKKHVKQLKHSTGKGIRKCKRYIVRHKKPILIGAAVVAAVVVTAVVVASTAGAAGPGALTAASGVAKGAGSLGNKSSSRRKEEEDSSSLGPDPDSLPSRITISPSPKISYSQESFSTDPAVRSFAFSSQDIVTTKPLPFSTQDLGLHPASKSPQSKEIVFPEFGLLKPPFQTASPEKLTPLSFEMPEAQLRALEALRLPLPPKTDKEAHAKAFIVDVFRVPQEGVKLIPVTGLSKDRTDRIALGLDPMKLQLSRVELMSGEMYIDDHFGELLPKNSDKISLVAAQNGINVSPKEFLKMSGEIYEKMPGKPLFIALYNPSEGLIHDGSRAIKEIYGGQTPITKTTKQFMLMISKNGKKVNDRFHWLYIVHSEAGAIECCAVDRMSNTEKDLLREQLYVIGLGPARPISDENVVDAINIYSNQDLVTLPFAIKYLKDPKYKIKIIPCISTWDKKSFYLADHALNPETTYDKSLRDEVNSREGETGFYYEQNP